MLGRGPLAGVVRAHVEEDRLAVGDGARAGGDLDALDVPTLDRPVGQGQRAHQRGVAQRQPLHLQLVVEQPAVEGAAARQRRRGGGGVVALVGPAVRLGARAEVGDLDRVPEAGLPQLPDVRVAVQHDLDRAGGAVLGEVELESLQPPLGGAVGRGDLDHLDPLAGGRRRRAGEELDRQGRPGRAAAEAAALHDEVLPAGDEALGELVGPVAGRAGDDGPRPPVEDGQVPVTAAGQPRLHDAGHGRGERPAVDARGARVEPGGAAEVARGLGTQDVLRRRGGRSGRRDDAAGGEGREGENGERAVMTPCGRDRGCHGTPLCGQDAAHPIGHPGWVKVRSEGFQRSVGCPVGGGWRLRGRPARRPAGSRPPPGSGRARARR